jgi:hypothetical protein
VNININGKAPRVSIRVDLSTRLKTLATNLGKELDKVAGAIAKEGKSFWKSEAGRKLKSSRTPYIDGLDVKVNQKSATILLSGFIPYMVEVGVPQFDMKPGFLAKAKPIGKRKIPRDKAASITPTKTPATMYRIIPLNVNRQVNRKPTLFRTVTDKSPPGSWNFPGMKGKNLREEVINELNDVIIPKHMKKLLDSL